MARRLIDDPQVARLLGDVADFTLYALDPEGICTAFEPYSRWYRMASLEEHIGRPLDQFYPPEIRAKGLYRQVLDKAAAEGRAEGEGWRYRKDGSPRWMRYIVEARRDPAGTLIGFVGASYDITPQHDSRRQLHATEEALSFLVNGLKDHAIYTLDPHGRVASWNAGAEHLLGYSADEVLGRHCAAFYTPEDRARAAPAAALEIARGTGRFEDEGWRMRKDGTRFRVHVLIQPLHDEEGQFVGFAKMTRDITQQHLESKQLADAHEVLYQSEKMRSLGELTGGIAHDFNNLLTVVRGAAELLQRGTLDSDRAAHQLEAIVGAADRAAELTGQLLSFARRQPLRPKRIDLNDLIVEMSEVLRRTLGTQIRFETHLQSDVWPVLADPTQLKTMILSAVLNARDAMPADGIVTLGTANHASAPGDEVCLAITDNGQGMSEEVRARAFEPFFTTKDVGKGTGLGLAQIYGFAGQSGGRAEIDSALGKGTTLRIFLPRMAVAEAAATESEGEGGIAYGTRILLVEDSRTVATFAQALLEDMGCETVHVASAEEALEALDHDEFDVVFSDIVMPGLSGLELAARVRAERPALPILLATGYSEAAARGEGGEFPILPKPYRREALAAMLGEAMGASRMAA